MLYFLIFLGLLFVGFIFFYNKLVGLRNAVKSSWSDIDVLLKKRFNLLPSLVEIVKGYAAHEKGVFEKVTQARSMMSQASSPGENAQSHNFMKDTLKSLFAVAEAYPELKANDNFMQLQSQFDHTETQIESARRYYNAVVRDFNTTIESFPAVMFASSLGFRQAEFFELEEPEEVKKPIRPDFS